MQASEEKEILSRYLGRIKSTYKIADDDFLEISALLTFSYSQLIVNRKSTELDFQRPTGESHCPLAIRLLKLLVEEFTKTKSPFSLSKFAAAILICLEDQGKSISWPETLKSLSSEIEASTELAEKTLAESSHLTSSEEELLLAYSLDRARHFHRGKASEQAWLDFLKIIDSQLSRIKNKNSILYSKLKYWREHFAKQYSPR